MLDLLNKVRYLIPGSIKKIRRNTPDLRCRLGRHDFFDPVTEQSMDAWFMEDIQRFREQYPIQKGNLYCKRCGKEKIRKIGIIFDSLPFMIQF